MAKEREVKQYKMKKISNLLIPLFFMFGVCLAYIRNDPQDKYKAGVEILKTEGPVAAIETFDKDVSTTGNPESFFGIAWAEWVKGNFSESERLCRQILDEHPSKKVQANCWYLLSHIQSNTGRYDESFQSFSRTFTLYEQLNHYKNMYNTLLGLAGVSVKLKDFDSTERFLDEALILNEQAQKNLGMFYHISTRLAFSKRQYSDALSLSYKAYAKFELIPHKDGMANTLSDIGFFLMLLGDYEEGSIKTKQAQLIIEEIEDESKTHYNELNRLLYDRCVGQNDLDSSYFSTRVELIQEYARENNDVFLIELLNFVLTWTCEDKENQ